MTIQLLLGLVAVIALLLTLIFRFLYKSDHNWIVSYLQNFCGVLFIISGFVKAVDPLGTAYKMGDYFNEFIHHIEPTWFSFMTGLFEWLNSIVVPFAVIMIVLELVIGVMLIIGQSRRTTAIVFASLVGFFTLLTGFTYLTGYVPQGATFFSFAQWTSFTETNMRVTDCGCFGDFIKLKPFTSFLKDIGLIIPAIVFLVWTKKMHQLFVPGARTLLVIISLVASTVYCASNYVWDLPGMDFRPFKVGTNIAEKKAAEVAASEAVEILAYKLKNRASGQIVELPLQQYLSNYSSYPKEEWEVLEQVKSEPTIEATKLSSFHIYDFDDTDIGDDILHSEKPILLVISHQVRYDSERTEIKPKVDSIFNVVLVDSTESPRFEKVLDTILYGEEEVTSYDWNNSYREDLDYIRAIAKEIKGNGVDVYLMLGGASKALMHAVKNEVGDEVNVFYADNILLKTIVRSNPGYVLIDDGVILEKWHKNKVSSTKILEKIH